MAALLWRSPTSGPWAVSGHARRASLAATHRGLGLILARQLLQMGELLVRGQVGGVGHGEGRGAAVLVLELASVLVVKARGSEDRGAHG